MDIRISRAEGYRRRRRVSALAILAVAASILTPAAAHAGTTRASTSSGTSSASSHTAASNGLTKDQAVAQARKSGKSVQVTSATTASSTLTANPNGTLTLTQSVTPVRKKINGAWQNLDATLVKTAHGYSPRVSTDTLTFSAGGGGPLVSLGLGTSSLSFSLPKTFTLTTPTVSGASATYHDVLPGVDLEVTADNQGGYSESLIVENATAAHNPALASIGFTTGAKDLILHADKAGNLAATTPAGAILYTAPAPDMWDSTTGTGISASTTSTDTRTGEPLVSGAHQPGANAHIAKVGVAVSARAVTLTPNRSLLTGSATKYPEYIDPTYTPSTAVSSGGAYAYTSSFTGSCSTGNDLADVAYYDDSSDYLRTGYSDTDCDVANYHTFLQIPVSGLAGSVISKTSPPTLGIYNMYSGSCTAETTELHQTGTISNNTTWNNEPTWNSTVLASASYAYGYTGCDSNFVGFTGSNLTSLIQSAATGSWPNITFGLKAATSNVSYSIRHYTDSATLTVTYDFTPSIAAVTGNPANTCESSAALAAAHPIGLDDVVFEAKVAQKLGTNLTAMFYLYNASGTELNPTVTSANSTTTTSSPTTTSVTAGQYTALRAHEAFFTTALGLTAPATFHWNVKAYDGTLYSGLSKTCYFTYDPTAPGDPTITSVAVTNSYCPSIDEISEGTTTATPDCTIGTNAKFQFTDTNTNGGTVGSYRYQLNGAAPIDVTPTSTSSPYTKVITLKPTRGTNILTITAVSSAGNVGGNSTAIFTATAPSGNDAIAGDLSGNGLPDLITVGNGTTTPAGLWEANGQASGKVETATDIGYQGDATGCTASAFNGDEAITGDFYDSGMQGILVYNPTTAGADAAASSGTATGAVFSGTGDGSAFQTANICNNSTVPSNDSTIETNITANELYSQYYYETSGTYDTPLQIANAYNADTTDDSAFDDLIGTNYDAASGAYFLTYFENTDSPAWGTSLTILANSADNGFTPTGGTDWNHWKIATTLIGGEVYMYLWNTSTGDLYLWQNVTVTSNGDATGTIAYTQYLIESAWSTASAQTFEAADITGKGLPDIWTVDAAGNVTATLISYVRALPTLTTTASTLATPTHNWTLNDYSATTAGDNTTTSNTALPLTGHGAAAASTDDNMFSPDINLDGTGGYLSTSTEALDLTSSFTVSFWTAPYAYGRMILSQDGTSYPGIMVYPTQSGWTFYLADDDGTGEWDGDSVSGGSAQLGTWAHVQATFDATTDVMSLYVDDTLVAAGSHTAPKNAASKPYLRLGTNIAGGSLTSYGDAEIALVQTWNGQSLAPNQPYTRASYHQAVTPERILDTRATSTNTYSGAAQTGTPVAADSTTSLQIAGDIVTPLNGGNLTAIPGSATAVAVDVTATDETASGNITTFADTSQQPLTSSTNYTAGDNVTGYQIVPIGPDGKIAIYNSSSGTTDLLVEITGYFTSNADLGGDQTYTPLSSADRILDSRTSSGIAYTSGLSSAGLVAAGATFTLNVTGDGEVPSTATAVAINLTATGQSGAGIIEAYAAGTTQPTDTSLTYSASQTASLAADVSLGTGSYAGEISIKNIGSYATDIIGDISGYFTTSTSGEVYHTVNPTRLADTRINLGHNAGDPTGAVATHVIYHLTNTAQLMSALSTQPTLALMLTVTSPTATGDAVAYEHGIIKPGTSNLNWITGQTIANEALVTTDSTGEANIYNDSLGSIQIVVDCSGYFATS